MSGGRSNCGWAGSASAAWAWPWPTRLLEAGHDVAVYNRTRAKAQPLAELGATIVDAPRRSRRPRHRVHDGRRLGRRREVVTGPAGPALARRRGARADRRLDDDLPRRGRGRSARRPSGAARRCSPRPVSGNPKVGGQRPADDRRLRARRTPGERARPYLELLARSVTYVGEGERARLVKICHNLMLGVVAQCMAEVTVLAEKGGVSRADFLEFLNDSVMGSTFTRYKSPAYVNLDFKPTFTPVAAAQGLPPRLRGRPRARGRDAAGRGHRADRPGPASASPATRSTSPRCSSSSRGPRAWSSSPRTSRSTTGSARWQPGQRRAPAGVPPRAPDSAPVEPYVRAAATSGLLEQLAQAGQELRAVDAVDDPVIAGQA